LTDATVLLDATDGWFERRKTVNQIRAVLRNE